MGALSIAFDTIIVGALALPWVLLVVHLFFSDNENSLKKLLAWAKSQDQPALAGVLLFAMTYPLGSAVSRIAQDFFDDDDLHIQVSDPLLLRVGITETSIRTDVYCQKQKLLTEMRPDSLAEKRQRFKSNESGCQYTGRWIIPQDQYWIHQQQDLAKDIFYVQEGALLLKGTDATEKLRVFHDQIMVLRGAAFDALVAFSLCFFWWCARFPFWLRCAVPLAYFLPAAMALYNHRLERPASDPPYMEFTLLSLAFAGWYLLLRGKPKQNRVLEKAGSDGPTNKLGQPRPAYLVLSLFLTVASFFGWWATQVLYDEQVIYSYTALSDGPSEPAALNPK
jgi:hypothetical protein